MNDLDLLKKVQKAAPLESPEFTGTPKVPTPTNTSSDAQIANTQFVSNVVAGVKEVITADINELKTKVDNIGDIEIDSDQLKNEIKNELSDKLSQEIIDELSKESVKISYADLESRQNGTLKQVDGTLDILNSTISELGDDKSTNLKAYKATLESKRSQLVNEYNTMKTAYDTCCVNNTTENYSNFTLKLNTWWNTSSDILTYCQTALSNMDKALIGYKADATQEAIFNLLTNNGEVQGIYYADVTGEDGQLTKQLFINGEYAQLRGAKVVDLNEDMTFQVTKSGEVHINASSFTLKGKTIDNTVSEAIANDTTIKDSIDQATNGLTTTVDDLSSKVDEIEKNMSDVSATIDEATKDGIITAAEVKSLGNLYNDMNSRQTAVLKEIDAILGLTEISESDKSTLNSHRENVVNSFSADTSGFASVANAYKAITESSTPTVEQFNAFDEAVEAWNNYVGAARACCKTILNNITTEIASTKLSNDREAVFNALTENGKVKGIFMTTVSNDSGESETQLYINSDYINTEDFVAEKITVSDLTVEKMNSTKIPTTINGTIHVYVNSANGDDSAEFKYGARYQTLQGAINACPQLFNGYTASIHLENDVTENIIIAGKMGNLQIFMQNNSIYGHISILDCHFVNIYGYGTLSDDTYNNLTTYDQRPSIIPHTYSTEDGKFSSISVVRTNNVQIKNVNIYNKKAPSEDIDRYVNVLVIYGQLVLESVGIGKSSNGFYNAAGKLITRHVEGYALKYGYYVTAGGSIDICRQNKSGGGKNAVGGATTNYIKTDAETINVGENVVFCTSELGDGSTVSRPTVAYGTYSLQSNEGRTYRTTGLYKGWKPESIVRQGIWTTNYGKNRGYWFFGTLFDQFKGKDVTKIQITITRNKAGNWGLTGDMRLMWHKYENQADADDAIVSSSEGPVFGSTWYKDLQVKSITSNAAKVNTFILTPDTVGDDGNQSADKADLGIFSAIKLGLFKGFGICNDTTTSNKYYQQYSYIMNVIVTTKETSSINDDEITSGGSSGTTTITESKSFNLTDYSTKVYSNSALTTLKEQTPRTYARQGYYNNAGYNKGFIKFSSSTLSSLKSTLSSASSIVSMQLYLHRELYNANGQGHGWSSGATVSLYAAGSSSNYLITNSGITLTRGEARWIDIPTDVINGFKNGTYDHFQVYVDASKVSNQTGGGYYIKYVSDAQVKVTYKTTT